MSNPRDISLPPAFQEQIDEARSFGRLVPFLRLISWFGIGGDRLKILASELKGYEAQVDSLVRLIGSFHNAFSELGWLFSDSTSVETAEKALNAHMKGNSDEAEILLVSDFDGDRLDSAIMQMCQLDEFRERRAQLGEASALTREGRYLAATPLLLIIADGVGTDAFGKSIFAEGVNLEELNSFAGQSDALPELIRKICGARRKTSSSDIRFPYRNGIIHGRDLGYGNRLVNAKCWSLLGNIADVVRARKAGQALKTESKPSFRKALASYAQTKRFNQRINEWVPRPAIEEIFRVSAKTASPMATGEPESAVVDFIQAWKAGNYGRMAEITQYYDKMPINTRAGAIRQLMEGLTLTDTVITRIEDIAPAVTEITVDLEFRSDDQEFTNSFVFRMICQDRAGGVAIHGDEGARWLIRPDYQYQYWTKQWS